MHESWPRPRSLAPPGRVLPQQLLERGPRTDIAEVRVGREQPDDAYGPLAIELRQTSQRGIDRLDLAQAVERDQQVDPQPLGLVDAIEGGQAALGSGRWIVVQQVVRRPVLRDDRLLVRRRGDRLGHLEVLRRKLRALR